MMASASWKNSLRLFFAERAKRVGVRPALDELCLIAGREPRLWRDQALYDDLIASIVECCRLSTRSEVLEVGCAAGFLARGIAPLVERYVGVDIAHPVIRVARRLHVANAEFRLGDGSRLPFGDSRFDAALCYDVFTNFPDFESGAPIIGEMLRVVRPGGRVLIGSVPDVARQQVYEERVKAVVARLDRECGPVPGLPNASPRRWYQTLLARVLHQDQPGIVCYYFNQADFETLGRQLGARTEIRDIHQASPYAGCRFNAVYVKPRP